MRKKTPRAICLEILNRMEKADRHPDHLLNDSFKRYRHLTPLDRAFLTELTYGILRWREKLDWSIRHLSKIDFARVELETLNILRLGLYQIQFLSRTPNAAAVNESVELAKKFRGRGGGGFVNAILRSFLRKKEEIPYPDIDQETALYLSVTQSHPLWLIRRWIEEMGIEETLRICAFNNRISPLTLRTNTLKLCREELIEKLKGRRFNPLPTPLSEQGILFDDPPPVSELPFLNEGLFVIQDEASQLVTPILDPKPGERVLDGCASPGGKTSHIGQRMKNEGEIYAIDLNREKCDLINTLCLRLGVTIVRTMIGDATQTLPLPEGMKFDRVLADVPCSGFGTLRRNPDLKWRKGEGDIRRLGELQGAILENLSGYVKEGGILVYSTCTVFCEENEEVVEKFLDGHKEFRLDPIGEVLPRKYHPFTKDRYLKTFPPRDGMDGFFVARLIKLKPPPLCYSIHPPARGGEF
ncbi:MAG: 16S rRNA (cytosine(967)-C(5))-methyltransferase RsmB [Thermodesulfobacteriota bacterium]|nr:16S rRNA (cytosine(967)-C(5))-methyltransferase RsmB [Thermodesulfobacteriota bacterium]